MFAQRIIVVGAGYVGLTTSACLASLGHTVLCSDIDSGKIRQLSDGEVQLLEPGLPELVASGIASGRLEFVVGASAAAGRPAFAPQVVFVCVPTPMGFGGAADLSAVEDVVLTIRQVLPAGCVLAIKSTVPVGTGERFRQLIGRDDIAVVSNPEFLREGTAVADFLHPDRVVVGSDSQWAAERVAGLYARLGSPAVLTDTASAEMIKYAANSFLAMKLSYINSIAEVCETVGADIVAVTEGMGHDPRIGQAFLRPGPGWGGPCLPKDVHGLRKSAADLGIPLPLLDATIAVNDQQHRRVVQKVRDAVGGDLASVRIGLLGLSFKAGTADLRDSPALAVAGLLAAEGAELTAYDPGMSSGNAETSATHAIGLSIVDDPYLTAKDAEAVVLLTEWPQFRTLDWARIARLLDGRTVVDTRNHLDPDLLLRAGLAHIGVGKAT